MTRKSRNDDALTRMRAANPFSAMELRKALGDAELSLAMQRAIAVGESPSQPIPAGDRVAYEYAIRTHSTRSGVFSRHRGASLGLGLSGLVCIAVVAALILLSGGSVNSVRDGAHPTFAAAAVKVAEANPRLLITAPSWSIVHARSFEVDRGELIYKNDEHPLYGLGGRQLVLTWHPARFYRNRLRKNGHACCHASTPMISTLLGQRATTFAYSGQHPNYATILSPQEKVFIEVNGSFGANRNMRPYSIRCGQSASRPGSLRCRPKFCVPRHTRQQSRRCSEAYLCRPASMPPPRRAKATSQIAL